MSGQPDPKTFTPPRKPRRRLPFQSAARRAEQQARRDVVAATHARSGYRCEARDLVPEVRCAGPLDCDEKAPRGRYPGAHLDPTVTQSVCRAHHGWLDLHPTEAMERGLRVPTPPVRKPLYTKDQTS